MSSSILWGQCKQNQTSELLCLPWPVVSGLAQIEQYAVTGDRVFEGKAPHEATILQSSMCAEKHLPNKTSLAFLQISSPFFQPPFLLAAGSFILKKRTRDGV